MTRPAKPVETRMGTGDYSRVSKFTSLLRVVSVGIWTVFWTTLALIVYLLTRSHRAPLAVARKIWAPGALWMMGAHLEIEGVADLDLTRPYLWVANHTSQLDIPVLFAALPIPLRFLVKEELRRVPLVGRFIAAMGMVFVDRGDSESARRSIERMAASLAGGTGLMAFPEGTRSRDGQLREFKTGAFVAAIKSQVEVVPIFIAGAADVLPAETLRVRPGRVVVRVGRPVSSLDWSVDDRRQLAELVRSRMVELARTWRDREKTIPD